MAEYKDYMIRAIAANDEIRAFAVTSRNLVEAAREAHNTSPLATAALGRTMSAAVMMNDMLKNEDDLLTLQFNGDGPLGQITVTADHHGNVKGFVQNTNVELPLKADGHLDVGHGVGKGTLTVIRDLDDGKTYNGQVEIHSGEIADDITHYFAESEQVPSSVGLGVLVDTDRTVRKAGGFIIQLMPFTSDETIDRLEKNLKGIPYVTEMLEEGLDPEGMLGRVLDGFDVRLTGKMPVQFHCNCTRDRVERALMLLGEPELVSMIEAGKDVELACQFCGKKYRFSVDDLKKIREGIMLSVLLIYGVIFITTYWLGRGLLRLLGLNPSGADAILYSMTGIAVAGFYAQAWSIFGGVSAAAFTVYALLALLQRFYCARGRAAGG